MKFFLYIFLLLRGIKSKNSGFLLPIIEKNDLGYLKDLPRFMEKTTEKNQLPFLAKFLIEDEDLLKQNNGLKTIYIIWGIFFIIGFLLDETPMESNERALKATELFIDSDPKYKNYEAYGALINEETLENWKIYTVLLMKNAGKHILKKVCLQEEGVLIAFVLDINERCCDKVIIAKEIEQKGGRFFPQRKGFGGLFFIHFSF